jgi:recombinase, phage RecT family
MANTGMIQQAAANKAVATKPKTLKDYVGSMEGAIAKALPSVMTPERFTRITLSALSTNPKLQETTPASFLGAMMTAAQLGLEPNTPLGQAYLLPYKNKGRLECQFQLGYKGLIDLAYRSGEIKMIQAHVVYENDDFDFSFGLEPQLHHVPAKTNRGEPEWVYASFETKDGGHGFEVMSIDDIQRHAAKYSQSYNSSFSPWKTSFEEMAKKTVLKRVLKYAPMRTDFVRAVTADEQTAKIDENHQGSEMPEIFYEAEYEDVTEGAQLVVDESTGEVISNEE